MKITVFTCFDEDEGRWVWVEEKPQNDPYLTATYDDEDEKIHLIAFGRDVEDWSSARKVAVFRIRQQLTSELQKRISELRAREMRRIKRICGNAYVSKPFVSE